MLLGILGGQTPVVAGMARQIGKAAGETWSVAKIIYRFLGDQRLKTVYQNGLIVGGTSAGGGMQSAAMLADNRFGRWFSLAYSHPDMQTVFTPAPTPALPLQVTQTPQKTQPAGGTDALETPAPQETEPTVGPSRTAAAESAPSVGATDSAAQTALPFFLLLALGLLLAGLLAAWKKRTR